MKKFTTFVEEIENPDNSAETTKRALITTITSNIQRLITQPGAINDKGLLVLIAALSVLNSSEDPVALATAKRLAVLAMTKRSKDKKLSQ